MLGIKPKTTISGTVYNGITDDDTRIDNLYPTVLPTRVNQPEVTVDLLVAPSRRVLPCFCLLLVLHMLLCVRFLFPRRQFD